MTSMKIMSNDFVKVGIDLERGGAISHLSLQKDGKNIVNTWDHGRHIQQSYYGIADGSRWNNEDWCWNPVQAGSWTGKPSKLISFKRGKTQMVVKTTPRNWGGEELLPDVILTTTYKLLSNGVLMKCRIDYTGTIKHPFKHQEAPACFFDSDFSLLVFRDIHGNLIQTTPQWPSDQNHRKDANATWCGYVDPVSRKAVVVATKMATRLTAYRVVSAQNPKQSNCSYFAPIVEYAIEGPCSHEYESSITLDDNFQIK